MKCPRCNGKTKVMRTRVEGRKVIRERGCKDCGYRFDTKEEQARRVWVSV